MTMPPEPDKSPDYYALLPLPSPFLSGGTHHLGGCLLQKEHVDRWCARPGVGIERGQAPISEGALGPGWAARDEFVAAIRPREQTKLAIMAADDIAAELVPPPPRAVQQEAAGDVGFALPDVTTMPVLDPRVPFSVHSTDGETVAIRTAGDGARSALGFRPADEDLSGYVVLDFDGFDRWLEEDDEIVGHPHDPFQRIDVRDRKSVV